MSTIQQLKNFIRHGRQARDIPAEEAAARKQQEQHQQKMAGNTEPAPANAGPPPQQPPADAYSVGGANKAAQAAGVAANQADQKEKRKSKRIDENLAKLIAEENERKSKFPKYPGLERWELLEKMGDGAFSNVYKARDREGKHGEAAIKVVRKYEMNSQQGDRHLHPDFKKVPKAAERANILKEVQIMRQLDHPNIIRLIDFSESKQYYYIVLELAPGGELFHQIVRLTYFSEELSRHVITQVANALEYLHEERGVVHRDIKPENILFYPIPFVPTKNPKPKQPGDEDKEDEGEFIQGMGAGGIGQIKIADFGLSKVLWDNQTMTPCGTVGYTAPEIVKDERYSKSVDMWALGCVLYTLLCGFPPFYDESIDVLTQKVARGEFTFLSPWWDDISKSSKDLISHLLEVDPEKRYTIKEFLAHPWIRATGPTPREEKKPETLRAFDSTRFVDGNSRMDFRSPGAVNLREVFDVGYAVHRQEEEAKRRKNVGAKAGLQTMQNVSEEDEDEEMTNAPAAGGSDAQGQYKADMTQQLERSMRNANLNQGEEPRGRERERVPRVDPQAKGYGQHSVAVTQAARQQVRDRNKQKGAFELNLDGATLLGRRGAKPAMKVGGL